MKSQLFWTKNPSSATGKFYEELPANLYWITMVNQQGDNLILNTQANDSMTSPELVNSEFQFFPTVWSSDLFAKPGHKTAPAGCLLNPIVKDTSSWAKRKATDLSQHSYTRGRNRTRWAYHVRILRNTYNLVSTLLPKTWAAWSLNPAFESRLAYSSASSEKLICVKPFRLIALQR